LPTQRSRDLACGLAASSNISLHVVPWTHRIGIRSTQDQAKGGMYEIIEALRGGTHTVQQLISQSQRGESRADAVWHEFALACAEHVLAQEREEGREPHRVLYEAIAAKRAWLQERRWSSGAEEELRRQRAAALKAAGSFGNTGYAFLQRSWRQITSPAILQQIRTSSHLIAMGQRAAAITYSFAALCVVTAMSPQPLEAAGQTAAAAIHYAVFVDETRLTPATSGQPTTGLFLGPPAAPSGAYESAEFDVEAQLQRPVAQEQAWQCEQFLALLTTQREAIGALLPLLHHRRQQLDELADRWQRQLEDALFRS